MSSRKQLPIALSIAGSDSGGGAGIQADLHTFSALQVHGTTAITCLTAQNPRGVRGVQPVLPKLIEQQISAVLEELPPAAIKTGMLYSAPIIKTVVRMLKNCSIPLVVDPVMVSTSGARLLKADAMRSLRQDLLPLAKLVTPNLDEAEILAGFEIREAEDLRKAARSIYDAYGCAVLVKGGHLKGLRTAMDILFDGKEEWLLEAPFVRGVSTHGTGCTYSAAITALLARGLALDKAVMGGKEFITGAISNIQYVGRHTVLNWARAAAPEKRRKSAMP
jgi:hydroxymethylpyrimidine/phosphomethylpyrimidine kinase